MRGEVGRAGCRAAALPGRQAEGSLWEVLRSEPSNRRSFRKQNFLLFGHQKVTLNVGKPTTGSHLSLGLMAYFNNLCLHKDGDSISRWRAYGCHSYFVFRPSSSDGNYSPAPLLADAAGGAPRTTPAVFQNRQLSHRLCLLHLIRGDGGTG